MAVADEEGDRLAYAVSHSGSDWMTWHVRDIASGRDLADEVPWAKFSSAAWLPDGSGFLYGAYPAPEPGQEHAAAMRDHQLRLHRFGTDATGTRVVHARPDQPEWGFSPTISHDGRWLLVTSSTAPHPATASTSPPSRGTDRRGPSRGSTRRTPATRCSGSSVTRCWCTPTSTPRTGRILAIDVADATRRSVVVEESTDRLEGATLIGGGDDLPRDAARLVCHHLHHATSR
jgi:prolyl oligopeptidase